MTDPFPLFSGPVLRKLRLDKRLGQRELAGLLGISVSYLSQIESGDRPLTPTVLAAVARAFPDDWSSLDDQGDATRMVQAARAVSDRSIAAPVEWDASLQRTLARQPRIADRLVALHGALQRAQHDVRVLDDRVSSDSRQGGSDGASLPWDETREWFHVNRNYVDAIDRPAEAIAEAMPRGSPVTMIERRLSALFGVTVVPDELGGRLLRAYDPATRTLRIDALQPAETSAFSLAHLLARLELGEAIQAVVDAQTMSADARRLLTAGLANYAAAAILMPYGRFRTTARDVRHDIDRLRQRFGTSFEQTCHRLSTLQRPGALGIPFFFCRVDMAGNITKRHSATRLQFARFGGACPLWIVHEAVAIPDRILVQLAEMPDGARYVSLAKGLVKSSGSYQRPPRRYAVALGCEVEHAADFVYAEGLQVEGAVTPIGVSCRICPRSDCDQRAFPPSTARVLLDQDQRGTVPYHFE